MTAASRPSLFATETYRLDNGLQVVLAPDHSTPVVGVNLWYNVGSRNEREGKTGFAHLFEHMMFQGSAHVPKNVHFELIEKAGGSLNATTWFDRTNYFETLPAEDLELALWLESDRMGWMVEAMTEEKLENQRDVVMNERRQRYDNQPYGDWDEQVQALLFPREHPYHHTVIGSMEDIKAATLDDVRDFFSTYYLPNNAVLTLCGAFEKVRAMALVERYFGPVEAGAAPPPIPGTVDLPFTLGGRAHADVEARVPLPRIYLASRVPPFTTEEFYAGQAVVAAMGMGRSARLYDRLVRETRIAKSVSCHQLPLTSGATLFMVVATGYAHTDIDDLEGAVATELEGLGDLAQSELDRGVVGSETRSIRELQQVSSRADFLSMFTTCFGDPDRLNRDIWRLRDVTLEEARAWSASYLTPANRAVVRYIPEGS
ncbi:MAG: M16 family metallopeptidase [Longimicrobiales bacterium]